MGKLPYSKKTQALIDRLCRIAERTEYTLDKERGQELILMTYDLFGLKRPSKIVWHSYLDADFLSSAYRASGAYRVSSAYIAYSAYSASRAYSAYSASSAYRASSASSAYRAPSAYSAYSAYRASSAYRAYSASRAYSAYSEYRAYSAPVDIDFDWSLRVFEYIQNPESAQPTKNDYLYLEYSKLTIDAKECGVGYFCDIDDTLHLVPVPIIKCDEQQRYHCINGPLS